MSDLEFKVMNIEKVVKIFALPYLLKFMNFSDAPTTAPAWQVPLLAPGQTDRQTPEPMLPLEGHTEESQAQKGFTVSSG